MHALWSVRILITPGLCTFFLYLASKLNCRESLLSFVESERNRFKSASSRKSEAIESNLSTA